ncbi:MAG: MFS transporter [Anaerolineae bacterium]
MPSTHRRHGILLSLGIALFWGSLYVYYPTLAPYAKSLGANLAQVGLIVGSYGLTQALLRIPLGLYADWRGIRRPIALLGCAVSLAGALGLALARTPEQIFWFRALTGVAASTWVASSVMLAGYFPPRRAVQATSLAAFLTSAGQVVGTSAGGLLADEWGWKAPFLVAAGVAFVGALVIAQVAEPPSLATREPATLADIVGYARSRQLVLVSLAAALVQYVSTATTGGFVPLYAQSLGASPAQLGWVTTGMWLGQGLGAALVGVLVERLGERRLLLLGALVMVATTLAVPFCGNMLVLIGLRAAYGLGAGSALPVFMGLSIKFVREEGRAVAMGFYQAVYGVGMFVGPSLSGLLAERWGTAAVFWSGAAVSLGVGLLAWLAASAQKAPGRGPTALVAAGGPRRLE